MDYVFVIWAIASYIGVISCISWINRYQNSFDLPEKVHNERIKLTAGFLNTIGTATVGASIIVPFFSVNKLTSTSDYFFVFSFASLGLLLGCIFHFWAKDHLLKMK